MSVLNKIHYLCPSCMEEHDVTVVEIEETNIFKGEKIKYVAQYCYCSNSEEYYETEEQMSANDISMKDGYRKKMRLLTSNEIVAIRQKYEISQSDLAILLGWGEKTITRYEGHQVQDVAHDSILRKIDSDSEWYLELLEGCQEKRPMSAYKKYRATALSLFEEQQNEYLQKSIHSAYARYYQLDDRNGFVKLDLQKVIDVIRYFSNSVKVKSLYTVKLMKMLWYADALSFKKTDKSMTGLVYQSLPMGAVPIAYEHIIDLDGIKYEECDFYEGTGNLFVGDGKDSYPSLSKDELAILDRVIERFGNSSKDEIVKAMHKEKAYRETSARAIIQYKYAKDLSI